MKNVLYIFMVVVYGIHVIADDHTARRYAGLDRDCISSKYFLLSIPSVQRDLKLDTTQIERLKSAITSPPTNIPAIAEFHRKQTLLLQKASSAKERARILRTGNARVSRLIRRYLETQMRLVLTDSQNRRLEELYLQMRGISVIFEDTNLINKLNISGRQIHVMIGVTNSYHPILFLLRQRFLRLQIQPIRDREEADWNAEINCLARVITEIEKDQDSELLAVLNDKQLCIWNKFCGKPLSINWKIDFFSDTPFQQPETTTP
jgi:hypothetical protein